MTNYQVISMLNVKVRIASPIGAHSCSDTKYLLFHSFTLFPNYLREVYVEPFSKWSDS